jgi:catechol 2,3-dioxygenase-like lactoylglutathione lyase family enzyme
MQRGIRRRSALGAVGLAASVSGLLAACAPHGGSPMTQPSSARAVAFSTSAAIARYQVQDVDRAVAFYTEHLGFHVKQRSGPVIAIVTRGDLQLILSGAGSSGARPMPDGRRQEPGGWNRIVLYVDHLDATIAAISAAGAHFRNEVEVGPGGKQILVDDPDGNPVELHEAPAS